MVLIVIAAASILQQNVPEVEKVGARHGKTNRVNKENQIAFEFKQ